jgi:hypothetical protein
MSGPGGDVAVVGPASGWNKLIRRFNRLFLNPLMLFAAGRLRRSYPAVVHHVGRHSGRAYRTPVVAQPVASPSNGPGASMT